MIALTRSQDNVEAINKALRNAGHPVHVTWLPDARDLGDALTQASAEMLMLFADEGIVDLSSAMDFRARFAPDVPVLIVREKLDEDAIAQALALGAQDAVTLTNIPRLQLVVGRELRTYRLDRALSTTLASAREYKKQLQHIVEGSTDAIAQVQEGIIVDANPAWLALFGYSNAEEVVGTPLMDAFDPDDHAAIKGALVACMQGKWSGHTLHASALVVSGHTPSLEFQLVRAEFDGEPCVQVVRAGAGQRFRRIPAQARGRDAERPGDRVHAPPLFRREAARAARRAGEGRRALPRLHRARQVRGRARGARRAGRRGFPDRFRAPAARAGAAGRPRGPLRRPRLHAAARARQHPGRRGLVRARRAQGRVRSLPGGREVAVHDLHRRPRPGAAGDPVAGGPGQRRLHGASPGPRPRRQPRAAARAHRRDAAPAGPGPPVGQADQGGADGEPLPAGAAADREPGRRGPRHVRRAAAHARRDRARKCCPRSSCRPPSATT